MIFATQSGGRELCVRAAMPAQPQEIIYLSSKPVETRGRKATGANEKAASPQPLNHKIEAQRSGFDFERRNEGADTELSATIHKAGSEVERAYFDASQLPGVIISPLGKPPETMGRKAMGAKATEWTQSQPGRRRYSSACKPSETVGRKAMGTKVFEPFAYGIWMHKKAADTKSARPPESLPPIITQ